MMRRLTLVITLVLLVGTWGPLAATATQPQATRHRSVVASGGSSLEGFAPTGHGPAATAYDPSTDTIYVANGFAPNKVPEPGGNTVSVIDARRCDARSASRCRGPWPTVTVGNEPSAIAVDPARHTMYVGNNTDGTVSVIDTRRCQGRDSSGCVARATVPMAPGTWGMTVDDEQHTLYVAGFDSSTVSLIDTATCNGPHPAGCPSTPPPAFSTSDGPGDVDVNGRTHTAYVATLLGFDAFDTRTCNATTQAGCGELGSFPICDGCFGPFSARVDESTNTIYEGNGDQQIVAVDGGSCNADDLAGCADAPFGTVDLRGPGIAHVLGLVVDEALHSVYVLNQKDDHVVVIDTTVCNGTHRDGCATLVPDAVHTGTNPQGIALDERTHTVYVADLNDDDLAVIDGATCSALDRSGCRRLPIRAPVDTPFGVAVSEPVHTAYVASGADQVVMLDLRTCNVGRVSGCDGPHPSVTVGDDPRAIAVDEPRHTAYVASESGTVSVLDTRACNAHPTGCAVLGTLAVPQGRPSDIVTSPRTGTVYVAASNPGGTDVVVAFDASTCNATRTSGCGQAGGVLPIGPAAPCGTSRLALGLDQPTQTVYAAQIPCDESIDADRVQVFDGRNCRGGDLSGCGAPVGSVRAGRDPFGLAVDERTRTLYAPLLGNGEDNGQVSVIDIRTCNGAVTSGCDQTPALAPAEFGSLGVAVDPGSHAVYVTNDEDASVSVIDGVTCRAGRTTGCSRTPARMPTDDYPTAWIALAPSVRTAYVSSLSMGTVSVIPMGR